MKEIDDLEIRITKAKEMLDIKVQQVNLLRDYQALMEKEKELQEECREKGISIF